MLTMLTMFLQIFKKLEIFLKSILNNLLNYNNLITHTHTHTHTHTPVNLGLFFCAFEIKCTEYRDDISSEVIFIYVVGRRSVGRRCWFE